MHIDPPIRYFPAGHRIVGAGVGLQVGSAVGLRVGTAVGLRVGTAVGFHVGATVGLVGTGVGREEGVTQHAALELSPLAVV